MDGAELFFMILFGGLAFILIIILLRSVRQVPQQRMDVVERLGR